MWARDWDLFILSHAVREGRRDALTRIHRAHRILARIIPRRQSLHGLNFCLVTHTRKSQRNRNGTHDHEIERHKDPTLRPVRLGVRRDVVDEEARADEENDLEQI